MSTDTKWLSESERATWVQLAAVLELLPALLDSQLRRDADLTFYEYYVLAMLSEAPDRTLRMSALATQTNATLARLSHVVKRLADRRLVERYCCPEDGRSTNVRLTDAGLDRLVGSAPGHVATVREHVLDPLTADQVSHHTAITAGLLKRLDPDARMNPRAAVDDEESPDAVRARLERCPAPYPARVIGQDLD